MLIDERAIKIIFVGTMNTNFDIGNVVRLQGCAREMVVRQVSCAGQVQCVWFTGTDVTSYDWFAGSALELIDDTAPPEVAFQSGDRVLLPIEGPEMTVVKVDEDEVECVWFSGFNQHPQEIDVRMLGLIRKNVEKVGVNRGPITDQFKTRMLWRRRESHDKTAWFDEGDEVQLRSGGRFMNVTQGGSELVRCVCPFRGLVTFEARTLQLTSDQTTASELLTIARKYGISLDSTCHDDFFVRENRMAWFFRKTKKGVVYYGLQGTISVLPEVLKESESAFRGAWSEGGYFEDIEQTFAFLKAWLIEQLEVDELPKRHILTYGI